MIKNHINTKNELLNEMAWAIKSLSPKTLASYLKSRFDCKPNASPPELLYSHVFFKKIWGLKEVKFIQETT